MSIPFTNRAVKARNSCRGLAAHVCLETSFCERLKKFFPPETGPLVKLGLLLRDSGHCEVDLDELRIDVVHALHRRHSSEGVDVAALEVLARLKIRLPLKLNLQIFLPHLSHQPFSVA